MKIFWALFTPLFMLANHDPLKFQRIANTAEKPIVIVIASYNNAPWYTWNLDSVFCQKYNNYHVIYIDDCSTDDTYELVQRYITEKNMNDKVTLIRNKTNRKALANHYDAIMCCEDTDIIAILDGDDAFAHDTILQRLNQAYADENVWMTYGKWKSWPQGKWGQCKGIPAHIIQTKGALREHEYVQSHLRTFYAGLFKHLKLEDLLYEGEFIKASTDMATMIPMHEMAQFHCLYIKEFLYLYNTSNPLNVNKVSQKLQGDMDREIRNRKPYDPIESPFNY